MHLPALIQDLAVILALAAVITFVFRRIKQPVVLGYIVAGLLVGPHTPAVFSVADTESIKVWAELGVIFLMFTLGLEFSFRRLARVGASAVVTAVIQLVAMVSLGVMTARVFGWSQMDAAFLGCMIAISSTTIIIKALEELGLKSKRFAELVFGILIVEDLAAILMLVALTNIATTAEVAGLDLLLAAGKLAVVVGAWFVVGMFIVPRAVRSVGRHGNDEMLTVVATGLCLALVALAAYFHYSAALGAFIMGSILAESVEARRIEHLVQPLKDVFGAVFFVSVGMLLDPQAILDNWQAVGLISLVIIVGKVLSVSLGAFGTGQSIRSAVQTGFSMAQIGEFSFIIGSLGLSLGVIDSRLYPIIVAASLVTTFTTPYLVKLSGPTADLLEKRLPPPLKAKLDAFSLWTQRQSVRSEGRQQRLRELVQWLPNAIITVTLFMVGSEWLLPLLRSSLALGNGALLSAAPALAWGAAFVLSAPSIWAMLTIFRRPRYPGSPRNGALLLSRLCTAALVGLMSAKFFPAPVTLGVTLAACALVLVVLRQQIEVYYRFAESRFLSGFQGEKLAASGADSAHERLAPWDAHLVEIKVPARSFVVGESLLDLKLRERYGINVVVIVRDGDSIVAPKAGERLYPADLLLCFGTDAEVDRFRQDLFAEASAVAATADVDAYDLRRFKVAAGARFAGKTIRHSGIHEAYDCIVVGLERDGQRVRSPRSDMALAPGDVLWIVGEARKLQSLGPAFDSASAS